MDGEGKASGGGSGDARRLPNCDGKYACENSNGRIIGKKCHITNEMRCSQMPPDTRCGMPGALIMSVIFSG
jgi:hypothetical protein